jgi:peroxiredoxin
MKKSICSLAFAGLITLCSAQTPHYEISGKIDGAEGLFLSLQKNVNGKIVTVNGAAVTNGIFKITGGTVAYPELVSLVSLEKKKGVSFFLENTNISITGELDSLGIAKIEGSKTQDELNSLAALIKPQNQIYEEIGKRYQKASQAGNTKKTIAVRDELDSVRNIITQIQTDFVKNNTGSYAVPFILRNLGRNLNPTEIETYLNAMDPKVARTALAIEVREKNTILKNVEIGQKAPDFTALDPSGNEVSLSSKTGKGLLLIDFWAAWCTPCRVENPNVVRVYKEFNKKGFDILGVSLDRTEADWNKAISSDKLTWTHVSDLQYWSSPIAKLYGVNSIPANFLLDKNGIIVAKNLRGEALSEKVKELFGAK